MRKSVTYDQKENEKVRSEISSMRRSKEIEKIDEQRKKIQSLILETSKAEQRNQKLTKLVEILEKQVPELAPENQAAFDEIQELMQQLTDARQKYFKKCDELIATRDKQVKELQNLEKTRKKQPGSNQPPKIVEPAEKPNSPRGRKAFSQPIQTPVEETENTEENADHININVNDDEDEVMKQYLNSNDNDNDNNDNIDNDNNDENDNDNRNIEDNPPENYEENETGENANDDDQIEVDHTEVDHIEVDRTEVDHIEVDQIENGNENRENITNEVDNDENTPEQEGDIVETTRVSFDLLNVQPNESELSMIPTDDENEVHDSDDIHVDDS
ncbi:hypothetical protein TRFO_31719 [Tritrichomonas foetus]|uniref:Uncharacterized protein n=1 Tax=Tritrichomonas foetus TaxID=1144522 RepID=A0A1J4JV99_9EUKA|nr:hypothetical protein TRFO_31719 [Tritrichomonas foetus]|eukprot:OHT01454.1 hypothetical protein TRFO_31719 [Tritrichomonas foetus]